MSEPPVDLKARLMAWAKSVIEKLPAKRKPAEVAGLADVEPVVSESGLEFE